jgi:hypothetical protein
MSLWSNIPNNTCVSLTVAYTGGAGNYIDWGDGGSVSTLFQGNNRYRRVYGQGPCSDLVELPAIWDSPNLPPGVSIGRNNGLVSALVNTVGTFNSTIFARGDFGVLSKDIVINITGSCATSTGTGVGPTPTPTPTQDLICRMGILNLYNTNISIQKNKDFYGENNSWTSGYDEFASYGQIYAYTGNAGFILDNYGQQESSYSVKYGPYCNIGSTGTGLFRQSVSLRALKKNALIPYESVSSNKNAWASYAVGDGLKMSQQSNNVFSYSIEFVKQISSNYTIAASGGTGIESGLSSLTVPEVKNYTGNIFALGGTTLCPVDCGESAEPPEPLNLCWTGKNITGADYWAFISGIAKRFPSNFIRFNERTSTLLETQSPPVSGDFADMFNIKSGYINWNNFIEGDSVNFNLYAYNYTGLYRQYHLNNNPIHSNVNLSFQYGKDFFDINSLTNSLNASLNDKQYKIWYPYLCLSGQPFGLYITGSLMSFSVDSGDGNKINFISNRNYTSGFDISLTLARRDKIKEKAVSKISGVSGYSYMLPDSIELQARTGSRWLVLDRRTNLYAGLTGLEVTTKKIAQDNWLNSGDAFVSNFVSPPITGELTGEEFVPLVEDPSNEDSLKVGEIKQVYQYTQYRYEQANKYCAPENVGRGVNVLWPSGFPSGYTGGCEIKTGEDEICDTCCKWSQQNKFSGILISEDKLSDYEGCKEGVMIPYVIIGSETCYICTGVDRKAPPPKPLEISKGFYRTGWNLNPTGEYLSCLLSPDYDLTKISFPEYRVVLKNFRGVPINQSSLGLQQQSGFIVKNINLFSSKSFDIGSYTLTGKDQCAIGSDYTLQVQGITRLPFVSGFPYVIDSQSQSGVYTATNEAVPYTPVGNEINTYFINSPGVIVGDVTGFVNGTFTGSGVVSAEFKNNYLYDPVTNNVYFETGISGYTSSGLAISLSGQAYTLTQNTINSSVVAGGVFSNQMYYQNVISGDDRITGLLTGVSYSKGGVTGLYYLTGRKTGISNNGYYNHTEIINTGYSYIAANGNAFYSDATGSNFATATININTGYINNFDYISINGITLTYNSDTLNYVAPSFFNSIPNLLNIINTNQTAYACSGFTGVNGNLNLVSILSGDAGNDTQLQYFGSGMVPLTSSFTGGKYFYITVFPTGGFSGILNINKPATGIYTTAGSGYLQGYIQQFQGNRNFTGVWGIRTGYNDIYTFFAENGLMSGSRYYSRLTSGDLGLSPSIIQMAVGYNNYLNTLGGEPQDVVRLTVSGLNFGQSGSGISFELTGIR